MKIRKKSKKQEEKIAKDIQGKTVIASGSLWGMKGDVRNDMFLVEAKFTDGAFYNLQKVVWDKIRLEAYNDGLRIPVMQVMVRNKKYCVIREDDILGLANEIKYPLGISNIPIHSVKASYRLKVEYSLPVKIMFKGHSDVIVILPWQTFLDVIEGSDS